MGDGVRVLAEGTHNMDEDEWLEYRRKGIGSSDAGALVGVNPWSNPMAVYMDKTGQAPEDETSLPAEVGRRMEDRLAEEFEIQQDLPTRRRNAILQHPTIDFMLCNIDRYIVGDERQLLEIKNSSPRMKPHWYQDDGSGDREEIPPPWMETQVQHQLAVTGLKRGILWGYFGGTDFQRRVIERDEEFIELLVDIERRFWERVQRDEPPPIDPTEQTTRLLEEMYSDTTDAVVDLTTQENKKRLKRYDLLKTQHNNIETEMDLIKNQMRDELGVFEKATVTVDGEERTVLWQTRSRSYPDKRAIFEEYPQLLEETDGDLSWREDWCRESQFRVLRIY